VMGRERSDHNTQAAWVSACCEEGRIIEELNRIVNRCLLQQWRRQHQPTITSFSPILFVSHPENNENDNPPKLVRLSNNK
jgi:hypothetical protein